MAPTVRQSGSLVRFTFVKTAPQKGRLHQLQRGLGLSKFLRRNIPVAQLTNPIGQIFHETLCAKITADGGDYRVSSLGQHAWEGCRDWLYDNKILNLRSIARGSLIRNNFHNARQRDCFLRTLDAGLRMSMQRL